MTKVTLNANEDTEVDFGEMEKRITDNVVRHPELKKYFEELKTYRGQQEANGKGVVEAFQNEIAEKNRKVVEEFRKGEGCDPAKIKEQWTVCVPYVAHKELAGHLRDYVWVTDVVKGKAGETVNIPTVKDVDFEPVTPKTGTFSGKSSLINVLTTTLHEAGTYYDAYYGDIEKIDSNMLDEINRVFAHAAVRAEDRQLVRVLATATSGNFVMTLGDGTLAPLYVGTEGSSLTAAFVVDAIAALMAKGKEVRPGECILLLNPQQWKTLAHDIVGSTPMSTAMSDLYKTGLIESFLGVKLIVPGSRVMQKSTSVGAWKTTYDCCFLMRPKRALALAPKRDILIETDKLIHLRQLRIAASHTFGVKGIDLTEVVPIRVEDISTHA